VHWQRLADREELDERISRLIEHGEPSRALAFLARHPRATPRQQCDLILTDQAYRWQSGRPRPLQYYFTRWPAVAAAPELAADLMVQECRLAAERGRPLDPAAVAIECPVAARRFLARWQPLDPGQPAAAPADPVTVNAVTTTSGPAAPPAPTPAEGAGPTVTRAPSLGEPTDATGMYVSQGPPAGPAPPVAGPPQTIGRFVIERVLGEGGFGTVYLARDEELRRDVAVKVPKARHGVTERDIENYLAEARVVASLDHPAIVPVYDVGRTPEGVIYVVSKFVPGTDLAARLRQGRLPLANALAPV